ncbi:hypothetical protein PT974_05634 [Cladobotryum mycophilum]|uniref:Uncharacterized protein n=1 Tax=Cladobotryum mycophilum TaxID=491253 RepID=A0ABR0SJD6_9HYPO
MEEFFRLVRGAMEEPDRTHVQIHHQCGACGYLFMSGDPIVALVSLDGIVRPYKVGVFTKQGNCDGPEDISFKLCKHDCSSCLAAEETATFHMDCLNLFKNQCHVRDKYRRLWIAATNMYPWRRIRSLLLPHSEHGLWIAAREAFGFQDRLPPEIWEKIKGFVPSHVLWRYGSVMQLAREVNEAPLDEAVTYPLYEVESWTRGGQPTISMRENMHFSAMRLTFDFRGIKRIDRVPVEAMMKVDGFENSRDQAFVTQWAEHISQVKVNFKFGRGRLDVPVNQKMHIWDTPTPLGMIEHMPETPLRMRLVTINTDPRYCTGISFFSWNHATVAIFAHTKKQPSAVKTFRYFNNMHHSKLVWTYVPLTADDEVTAFGRRCSSSNLFGQMDVQLVLYKKSGRITIGTDSAPGTNEILCMADQAAQRYPILIHEVNYPFHSTAFVGLDPPSEIQQNVIPQSSLMTHQNNFSSAPLYDVVLAKVFKEVKTGLIKGILLEYRDGSKKALGQCRVGLDSVQSFTEPSFFHHTFVKLIPSRRHIRETAFATFASRPTNPPGVTPPPAWWSFQMVGTLEVYFNFHQFRPKVVGGVRIQH